MPHLSDFKTIVLYLSQWDKDRSDPRQAKYVFTGDKHYLKNDDYKSDEARRPKHVISWCRWDKASDYIDFRMWQSELKAEAVRATDCLYWPEPLAPNAEDHYVWKDAIMVQIPLDVWLKKRKEDKDRYDKESQRVRQEFQQTMKEHGADLELDDDIIRKVGI